jgi:hypothetical protein
MFSRMGIEQISKTDTFAYNYEKYVSLRKENRKREFRRDSGSRQEADNLL